MKENNDFKKECEAYQHGHKKEDLSFATEYQAVVRYLPKLFGAEKAAALLRAADGC